MNCGAKYYKNWADINVNVLSDRFGKPYFYLVGDFISQFILLQYCLLSNWENEDIVAKLNTIRNNLVKLWLDLLKKTFYMNL